MWLAVSTTMNNHGYGCLPEKYSTEVVFVVFSLSFTLSKNKVLLDGLLKLGNSIKNDFQTTCWVFYSDYVIYCMFNAMKELCLNNAVGLLKGLKI